MTKGLVQHEACSTIWAKMGIYPLSRIVTGMVVRRLGLPFKARKGRHFVRLILRVKRAVNPPPAIKLELLVEYRAGFVLDQCFMP